MNRIFTLGLSLKLFSDAINLSVFNEPDGQRFYEATKKRINRMRDYEILDLTKKTEYSNFVAYFKKYDDWAEWAKRKGYLKGFQQNAINAFYELMFEAAKLYMPLNQNMTEHFFCYAFANVLYKQIQEYKIYYPKDSKYEAMYWILSSFEFFGDDNSYIKDFTPIASSFSLLSCWVKDMNKVIKYWEKIVIEKGKRDVPPDFKAYITNWKKGVTPDWKNIKIFFEEDLCPPKEYFFDDEKIRKNAYEAFKANLFMSYILKNLYDSLKKNEVLSEESLLMIRNGARLYFREFFVIRDKNNCAYSAKIEEDAKNNLMFRTLFCMLDGSLNQISTSEYLNFIYRNPEYPMILD